MTIKETPANERNVAILGKMFAEHDFLYFSKEMPSRTYTAHSNREFEINRYLRRFIFTTAQKAELLELAGSNVTYASDYIENAERRRKNRNKK